MDLDIFDRNVTDKVGNQKTSYYMPPQITCVSALPGKTRKSRFLCWIVLHTQRTMCAVFLEEKIVICDVFDGV